MKQKILFLSSLTLALLLCTSMVCGAAKLSSATDALASDPILVKGGILGEDVVFSDADFRQALGVTTYPDLTIVSLPDPKDGVLKVDGLRLSVGQVVRRTQVPHLVFTPSTHMVMEASFTFTAGNLCGGATLTCAIHFTEKTNQAPSAAGSAEQCLKVKKNVSVFGSLSGYDPEGDDLTYLIVTYPKKGSLSVTDCHTGEFSYTPRRGYRGKDTFTYVVRDTYGNYSPLATVTLQVGGADTDIDLGDGVTAEDALAFLGRRNILVNEGDSKNQLLSREAFVVALLKSCGYLSPQDATTFYDDDGDISPVAKPYIALATEMGIVEGTLRGGNLCFLPQDPITQEEARAMISRAVDDSALEVDMDTSLTHYLTYGAGGRLLYCIAVKQEVRGKR